MRRRHDLVRLSVLLLEGTLLGASAPRASSSGEAACASSRDVRAEIASIGRTWSDDTDPTFHRRVEALRALAKRVPGDVEAQLAYQDRATLGQRGLDAGREEYRKLHEGAPDSLLYSYLYARLLPPKEAEAIAGNLAVSHPEFPWGHLLAASLEARKGAQRDDAALRGHLARFQTLCSGSPASYRLVSTSREQEFLRAGARSLRALLERDENLVPLYSTLWSLEFKSVPAAGHPEIRERVRRDLARLAPLLASDTDLNLNLLGGFGLIEDVEGRRKAEETILEARPDSLDALRVIRQRFDRRNPPPEPGDQRKETAYYTALFDASTKWVARWKDYPEAWVDRLAALREVEGIPDEEAIRTGEGLLAALRKRPRDVSGQLYPFPVRVGELWLSRGIRLQEALLLADSSVTDFEESLWSWARGTKEDFREAVEEVRWLCQPLRVEASALLGRLEEARHLLAGMESAIPPPAGAEDEGDRLRRLARAALVERARAGLSAAEGRNAEALATYRKAASLFPVELRSQPAPAEAVRRARLLFRQVRGSLDGFDAWMETGEAVPSGAPASLGFEKRARKLPSFELKGVDGRTWRLADLDGKTVFVNVWATWCGPCRSELPYVQRLYEKLKNRHDALLLTLNVDDNVGLVAPFLKGERYSFPVLFANDYVDGLMEGEASIPRNWIVSRDGVLVLERRGFSDDEPRALWTRKIQRLIDSLSAPESPAPRPRSPAAPRTTGTPAPSP